MYWVMPLHLLAQAAWCKVFGVGLVSMRLLSTAWGMVALYSWYSIITALSGRRNVAVLAVALLGIDCVFIGQESSGRMDMMCAALGFARIAAYLRLRQKNRTHAVLLSQLLVAASVFTHPNGVFALAACYFSRFISIHHGSGGPT